MTSVPLEAVTLAGLKTKLPPAPTSICMEQLKDQHSCSAAAKSRDAYVNLSAGARWCGGRDSRCLRRRVGSRRTIAVLLRAGRRQDREEGEREGSREHLGYGEWESKGEWNLGEKTLATAFE